MDICADQGGEEFVEIRFFVLGVECDSSLLQHLFHLRHCNSYKIIRGGREGGKGWREGSEGREGRGEEKEGTGTN